MSRPFARTLPVACLAVIAAWLFPAAAGAAAGGEPGPSEVLFFFQLMLLIFAGRALGEVMQRIGQPSVTGQLIAGILLGPSLFGAIWPDAFHWLFPPMKEQKAMLDAISQVGIMMLLLLTGMETDLALVRRVGRAAASVSIAGIVIPFACGFALGEALPDSMLPRPELRIVTSLFLGAALSIASIKIVAMVVREMNYMRRNLGQLIVSSAIIDDSIGWIVIALIFSLAERGAVDLASLAQAVIGTLVFLAASLTLGRRLVFFIIRWTNDNFVSEVPVISAILLITLGMGLITHFIGVHSVLGAFIAGVLVGESPILTRHIDEQLRGLITAFFAPVFFGVAGLGADLTVLADPRLLLLTAGLILIASIGKFGGAFIGGKLGGLSGAESLALALGMNARGSTEVIIASIGLSLGALSQDLFTMIVAMAVVTTTAMPPTLRWALHRLPPHPEEEKRLEREAHAERGFVTNLERLLLAVDDSANGKFTARLAGVLSGARGMPTTVLEIGKAAPDPSADGGEKAVPGKAAESAVRAGQEMTQGRGSEDGESDKKESPQILTKVAQAPPEEAIASEAKKGYDLLFAGFERMTSEGGAFDETVSRVAAGFEGPMVLVRASGAHRDNPLRSGIRILIPVTGTTISRRAAEVAIVLARALNAPARAIYVKTTPDRFRGSLEQIFVDRRSENAILRDIVSVADDFNTPITTAVRFHPSPAEAILQEATSRHYDLIAMGVNRRPGDDLYFGHVAEEILEKTGISVLFVVSEAYAQQKRKPEDKEKAT